MTDEDFYRRVRNCNLIPSNNVRVWRDPHDLSDQYNVPIPGTLNDHEKREYIKELRIKRSLPPLQDMTDDKT